MPFFGNWKILESFLRGTLEHPNKAQFHKHSRIFNISLSYDGSILDHLAAHMPLHCIIIVAPLSCSFVVPACRCLLHLICHWHLCHASLF
jgi:hypothetical protein